MRKLTPTTKVLFNFEFEIYDTERWMEHSAHLYRLFELLKAMADVQIHAFKGIRTNVSSYEAYEAK